MAEQQLEELRELLSKFSQERDWSQFRSPRISQWRSPVEVGELVELFQWLTGDEAARIMESDQGEAVRDELADVLGYLIRLADVLDVDLARALKGKVAKKAERYPLSEAGDHRRNTLSSWEGRTRWPDSSSSRVAAPMLAVTSPIPSVAPSCSRDTPF